MIAADLNGDGNLDLISDSPNSTFGNVYWRANDGQRNFGENRPVTTKIGRADIFFAADLDRDGDLDIVTERRGTRWLENRPLGDAQ